MLAVAAQSVRTKLEQARARTRRDAGTAVEMAIQSTLLSTVFDDVDTSTWLEVSSLEDCMALRLWLNPWIRHMAPQVRMERVQGRRNL